ncbi:MAG: hypothetical protein IK088_08815 [Lachnospiraceae bacterium]|nr:hypothetical protein [Lachnospiraceae bacterium]
MATKSTKNTAAEEAAKKALEAVNAKKSAEKTAKKKVEHTITQVGQQSSNKEELLQVTRKNALPYRIFAVVFWVLALACEVFAVLFFTHKVEFSFTTENPGWMISWIAALVLDLVFLIIGSSLWKKANHMDPASKKNKVRFFLHNNLGVIVAAFAFIPFIILALLDKNADKKSKLIAVIVAAVALVTGGLVSVDWNPISQEEMLEAAGVDTVYWTASGTVFHAYEDCPHLNHSAELFTGTSTTAIEQKKTRLCKTCENRAAKEAEEGVESVKDAIEDAKGEENAAE